MINGNAERDENLISNNHKSLAIGEEVDSEIGEGTQEGEFEEVESCESLEYSSGTLVIKLHSNKVNISELKEILKELIIFAKAYKPSREQNNYCG